MLPFVFLLSVILLNFSQYVLLHDIIIPLLVSRHPSFECIPYFATFPLHYHPLPIAHLCVFPKCQYLCYWHVYCYVLILWTCHKWCIDWMNFFPNDVCICHHLFVCVHIVAGVFDMFFVSGHYLSCFVMHSLYDWPLCSLYSYCRPCMY